jgi:8-oxo-dGTP pyrophosphatase MutT (NUDIX family)
MITKSKDKAKNIEQKLDPRLHFVVATAIIHRPRNSKDLEFLLLKRAAHEKAFPNRWTVPGGKLVLHEYNQLPKTAPNYPQWYNVVDWVLKKEVKEEANLEIHKPEYLCDLAFVRPDGYPVVTLSYFAKYKKGTAKPGKDLVEHAWVTVKEAQKFDLIEGIWEEIRDVEKIIKNRK